MSSEVQRKLTTILAADAEGYSREMDADEVRTLGALRAARSVFSKFIERHHGRIASTAGDRLIAEFPSVVEAGFLDVSRGRYSRELVFCGILGQAPGTVDDLDQTARRIRGSEEGEGCSGQSCRIEILGIISCWKGLELCDRLTHISHV